VPVALALVTAAGCGAEPAGTSLEGRAVGDAVTAFVDTQQDRYDPPPPAAAADLAGAVVDLSQGLREQASRTAEQHGYEVVELAGEVLALAPDRLPNDRGWGLYVVRPGGFDLAVEVPHPQDDLDTEHAGAELASAVGARYLLVAGAGRRAAGGAADVAHREDAVFSAVHRALAERQVPAVQLHGFAADSLPGTDLVVSPGAAPLSALTERVADRGAAAGLQVCRAWTDSCGRLEGRTNAQGRDSAAAGAVFVHVEAVRGLRREPDRGVLVRLLAEAVQDAPGGPSTG
jgi:hypothetical protein